MAGMTFKTAFREQRWNIPRDRTRNLIIFIVLLMSLDLLSSLALCGTRDHYYPITGPCRIHFPKAHEAHPGYRTEWWYYTGNLRSESGEMFGVQLTFFRDQLSPPGAELEWPKPTSAWRTQQLFFAHAALTDIGGKHFYFAEEIARGALGMAGVKRGRTPGSTSIFVKDWSALIDEDKQILVAATDEFGFRLTLKPQKQPVLHGNSGYSLKGSSPELASCYYSITRIHAEGTVTEGNRSIPVKGDAWMDHEYSSAPLEPGLVGWDWFSLQLSNNTEIMIYLLRRQDGSYSQVSRGTFVDASGKATQLTRESFDVEAMDHWESSRSGARYPSRWRVRIHPLQIDLIVSPNLSDQELLTPETHIIYWEGSVSTDGTAHGQRIIGDGYVELTGYAKPLELPGTE